MNDVRCRLFFFGDSKRIEGMLKSISTKNPRREIDFEKIIPYPDNIYRGPLTAEAIKTCGTKNWYDFNRRHWEAYYNAYDTERTGNMIDFTTAWKPPIKIIKTLAGQFPDIEFYFKWCSRCATGPRGEMTICVDKGITDMKSFKAGSEDSEALAKFLWGEQTTFMP